MKKQKTTITRNNFWNFPEQLNISTIFLMILGYIILLLAILFVSFPGTFLTASGYIVRTDYPHVLSDDDISAVIKVTNVVKKEEYSTEEDKLFNQFSISASLNKKSDIVISNYELYYNAVYGDNSVKYFSTNKRTGFPHTYQMLTRTKVPDRQIKEINGEIHYKVDGEYKILKYSEAILKLSSKEISEAKLTNTTIIEDIFKITFKPIYFDILNYNYKVEIEVLDSSEKYHLDMQSWIESAEGRIYPLYGVYNLQNNEKKFASTDNEKIAQVSHPENVYFKVNYYDSTNSLSTFVYNVPFPNLSE